MYYIYILYSESADKYYVGYTSDITHRLRQHNDQKHFNTYTSKYRPWKLKALFECGDNAGKAMEIEKFIKKNHSRRLIEKLINPDFVPDGFFMYYTTSYILSPLISTTWDILLIWPTG